MADPQDIPLTTVLQHMQGMEKRIMTRINGVDARIDGLEAKVDNLEVKVDRYHAQTTVQIENIGKRLDDLEVVQVPTLKKAVGM